MNLHYFAAFMCFLAGVVFFFTGNTALGAVFVALGAASVALGVRAKDDNGGPKGSA